MTGMTCSSCVNRITRALRKLDGVTRIRVDLAHETVTVVREPALVSDTALAGAIVAAGYQADLTDALDVGSDPDEARSLIDRLLRRSR
ncbi:MAG: heavy metal-associated domain-containing protein [Chloroflexota bacterium]